MFGCVGALRADASGKEENTMTMNGFRAKPRRTIETEEERAWVSFYRRAGKDPAIAAEVLAQLDADAEMKREHLALYLCCRESLRLLQAREARHQRIGEFVRWLCAWLFVKAPESASRTLGRARDLAMACLPNGSAEPASAQVRRLSKDAKVRAARAAYKPSSASAAPAAQASPDVAEAPTRTAQAGG